MKRSITIIWLVCCAAVFAQENWAWQVPKPQGNSLFDIHAFDDVVLASGAGGVFMTSPADGSQWDVNFNTAGLGYIRDMQFIDKDTGFIYGWDPQLFRTIDGGTSWDEFPLPFDNAPESMFFSSPDSGYVARADSLYRTTDGGQSWTLSLLPIVFGVRDLHFANDSLGWMVSQNGDIYATFNSGQQWGLQHDANFTYRIIALHVIGDSLAWAVGGGIEQIILKSTNGGVWQVQYLEPSFNSLSDIHFWHPDSGVAVGNQGLILTTGDGGATWTEQEPVAANWLRGLDFYDGQNGWLVGDGGLLMFSDDGGQSWEWNTERPTDQDFSPGAVFFIDANSGWSAGSGPILKTDNGGDTWYAPDTTTYNNIQHIVFTDANNGFFVDRERGVYRTMDGGLTLDSLDLGIPDSVTIFSFQEIQFVDANTGWIAYNGWDLLKTTDGGDSWTMQEIDSLDINEAFFIDASTGWAVGGIFSPGLLLQTIDGGDSWTPVDIGATERLRKVLFADANNGWITADEGIFRTTDGGANWNLLANTDQYFASEFAAADASTLWMAGSEDGSIANFFISTDGGANWQEELTTSLTFQDLALLPNGTGWGINFQGILKRNSSLVSIDDDVSVNLPATITLHQNYPNPFNPETTIEFEFSETSDVRLTVYNLLGQQVRVLVDQRQAPGFHRVQWDGRDNAGETVSSGIYFYRLEAQPVLGSGAVLEETRRMILLK